MGSPRKPVPAGGQPIPAAIAAADAVSPTSTTSPADTIPAPVDQPQDVTSEEVGGDFVDAAVLVAFGDFQPDQIIHASTIEIEQLKLAGKVDPHPDAVAFVRALAA